MIYDPSSRLPVVATFLAPGAPTVDQQPLRIEAGLSYAFQVAASVPSRRRPRRARGSGTG
jgi:hypothetical protein